jgi:hypothetical protein
MKIKTFYSLALVFVLLGATAAVAPAKLRGKINFNNPYAKVVAFCNFSYVDFKANNGKIYQSSPLSRGLSEQSCTYSILGVPSGTTGTLRSKLTLYSKTTGIYTCWYSERKITASWLSAPFDLVSGWTNHADSLLGVGICQSIK